MKQLHNFLYQGRNGHFFIKKKHSLLNEFKFNLLYSVALRKSPKGEQMF